MLDWTIKKRLTICFVMFVLPLASFLFPPRPLLVSEETTIVKGPLDSSGKLDFFAHLNSEFENTPPGENGYHATKDSLVAQHGLSGYKDANLFIYHWWKRKPLGYAFSNSNYSEVSQDKIFGFPKVNGKHYELFTKRWGHSWDEHETSRAQLFRTLARYHYALEYPWKKEDAPVLGHYLSFIDEIWLDKFLEAAQYEKYISPLVPEEHKTSPRFYQANTKALLNIKERHRREFFPAQALHLKTTFMVGEGEAVSWLKQLQQIHRLIRIRHNSSKMQTNQSNFWRAEVTILSLYSKIIRLTRGDEKVLSQIEENLDVSPPVRTDAELVDRVWRFYALNLLQEVKEHGFGPYLHYATINEKPLSWIPAFAWSTLSSITDWDAQAEHLNRYFDEMVAMLNNSEHMSGQELHRKWFHRLLTSDMSKVTKTCLVLYWEYHGFGMYQEVMRPNLNLLNAQIAMERYRNQHGQYPSSLKYADVNMDVPEDMAEVPFEYANKLGYYFSRTEVSKSTAEYLPWSSDGHRSLDRNRPEPYFAGGDYFQFIGSNSFSPKDAALVEGLVERGAVFERGFSAEDEMLPLPRSIWFNPDNGYGMDDSSVSMLADAMLLDHRISYVFFENTSLSADGVISLVEKLSSDENMRPGPVTLMGPQINDRVINRYRELGTGKVRLQVGSLTYMNTVE